MRNQNKGKISLGKQSISFWLSKAVVSPQQILSNTLPSISPDY